MKIIKEKLIRDEELLSLLPCDAKDALFFDIETTGFHRDYTMLYLMGYVYHDGEHWIIEQQLAESKEDEIELLKGFITMANEYSILISYNGDAFDLPYLKHKIAKNNLTLKEDYVSMDIYKDVKAYKPFLQLENYKLKTIEKLVGIYREDPFTGGDLIEQYNKYLQTGDEQLEYNLLLHNKEDMIALVDLMAIYKLLHGFTSLKEAEYLNHSVTENQLTITCQPKVANKLAYKSVFDALELYLDIEQITITLPLHEGELQYYFKDYKNYYVLKDEDKVIHKTMASFLPKERLTKAKASNCFIKHSGVFVQVPDIDVDCKVFVQAYKEKDTYLHIEDFEKDTIAVCNSILLHLSSIVKAK